jgi:MFS family permease
MELWPNASRAWLAGWIGAFGNFGYLICAAISLGLNHLEPGQVPGWLTRAGVPNDWAEALTAHRNWRLLLLVGAVPALMTVFIRMLVPESEKWQKEKEAGRAAHWSERDLLGVLVGAVSALGVIALWALPPGMLPLLVRVIGSLAGLTVVVLGYLYPVRGYLSRCSLSAEARSLTLRRMLLAAGLSGVPLLGTWAGLMWSYMWVDAIPGGKQADAKAWMQMASSIGAAIGCVAAAVIGGYLGRRPVYAALCVISLVTMTAFYQQGRFYEGGAPPFDVVFVLFAGLLGLVSAAFYGWLPLYLPELFPTAVRATGQGFGFNFGRIIAAVGQLQMPNLLAAFNEDYAQACAVVAGVYVAGLVLITLAPETKGQPLPE